MSSVWGYIANQGMSGDQVDVLRECVPPALFVAFCVARHDRSRAFVFVCDGAMLWRHGACLSWLLCGVRGSAQKYDGQLRC